MLISDSPILFFFQTIVALILFILLFRVTLVFFLLTLLFAICSDIVYILLDLLCPQL